MFFSGHHLPSLKTQFIDDFAGGLPLSHFCDLISLRAKFRLRRFVFRTPHDADLHRFALNREGQVALPPVSVSPNFSDRSRPVSAWRPVETWD